MINPYLPANHQDAGDVPEDEEEAVCEACLDEAQNEEDVNNIIETGFCTRCVRKYIK